MMTCPTVIQKYIYLKNMLQLSVKRLVERSGKYMTLLF